MSFAKFSVFWEWRIVKSKKYPIRFDVDITELAFKLLCMIDIDQYLEMNKDYKFGMPYVFAEMTTKLYAETIQIEDISYAAQELMEATYQLFNAVIWMENTLTTGRGFIKLVDSFCFCEDDSEEHRRFRIRLSSEGCEWLHFHKAWFYDQYLGKASAKLICITQKVSWTFRGDGE